MAAVFVTSAVALSGCAPAIPASATPLPAASSTLAPVKSVTPVLTTPATPIGPVAAVTARPAGTLVLTAPATATRSTAPTRVTPVPLFLTVLSPANESETASAQCLIRGRTVAGAVVSVNGNLAAVDARGEFTYSITLEEGANVIEIIASDREGSTLRDTLLLDYAP